MPLSPALQCLRLEIASAGAGLFLAGSPLQPDPADLRDVASLSAIEAVSITEPTRRLVVLASTAVAVANACITTSTASWRSVAHSVHISWWLRCLQVLGIFCATRSLCEIEGHLNVRSDSASIQHWSRLSLIPPTIQSQSISSSVAP